MIAHRSFKQRSHLTNSMYTPCVRVRRAFTEVCQFVCQSLTEVCQFEFPDLRYEQVLWFQISVQDAAGVAVAESPQQLVHEELYVPAVQTARVLLQVLRQVRVLRGRGDVMITSE